MRTFIKRITLLILACCFPLMAAFAVSTQAQETPPDCPALVTKALEATSDQCLDIGRNEACYGHTKLSATARDDVAAADFTFEAPGDRIKLEQIASFKLEKIDLTTGDWGVGYMRMRANLPDVAAGQFVTVIMFGDTEVRDASVEFNTQNGNEAFSPMQAFYFRTGIGGENSGSLCNEFPTSGVLIQTPKGGQRVDLVVNEVKLNIGSTILLEAPGEPDTLGQLQTPTGVDALDEREKSTMKVTTFEGEVIVEAAGNIEVIGAGEQAEIPLDSDSRPSAPPEKVENPDLVASTALLNLVIEAADEELIELIGVEPTPEATEPVIGFLPTSTPTPLPTATPTTAPVAPPPPSPEPQNIVGLVGNGQSAVVGASFAQTMQVKLLNGFGDPVSNYTVTFSAPASGPSLIFSAPDASDLSSGLAGPNEATATSDLNGIAVSPAFAANTVAGTYSVTITAGPTTSTFNMTNLAGSPAGIVVVQGSGQSVPVTTAFPTPFETRLIDSYGNGIGGQSVTFSAPASGASGTFAGSGTNTINALTDASGVARAATFTANGQIGAYNVTATFGVLAPATFSVQNVAGAPANMILISGNNQSTTVNTSFGQPLRVQVLDAGMNPLSGVPVTFTAPASGARCTFAGTGTNVEIINTDSGGFAQTTVCTANTIAGGYAVAAISGALSVPPFNLTNLPGAPANMAITQGNNQSAPILTAFPTPFAVQITDAFGNPISSLSVTFSAPASLASGTFAGSGTNIINALTNASGIATASTFTANSVTGTYPVAADYGALNASFSAENLVGAPSIIELYDGDGQGNTVGEGFEVSLAVYVRDAGNNPVPNVNVTFTGPASGASLTFNSNGTHTVSVVTDLTGYVESGAMTSNLVAGAYNVTVTAGPASNTFSLENYPDMPASLIIVSGDGQTTEAGTAFPLPLEVSLRDQYGNGIPDAPIEFVSDFGEQPGGWFSSTGEPSESVTTDLYGTATSSTLNATSDAGTFNVSATLVNSALSVQFTVTSVPGAPAELWINDGDYQIATLNTSFGLPLSVIVLDSNYNSVPNVAVTFTAPASGPSAIFAGTGTRTETVMSNQFGEAYSSTLTAVGTGGAFMVDVTSGAAFVQFNLTVNNPVPTLTHISPNSAPQNGSAVALTLTGSNFVPSHEVQVDGSPIASSFVSSTQINATLPASYLLSPLTLNIGVVNLAPGGGASATLPFTVTPDPTLVTVFSGSGVGTLSWAVANAPANSTIRFISAGVVSLTSEVNVGNNLTIDGSSTPGVIIAGSGGARLFSTSAGTNVTFRQLQMQGGAGVTGGIVLNQGNLTFDRVRVGSASVSYQGGAIFSNAGTVTITDSVFGGMTSITAGDSGGVIAVFNGSLVIRRSAFANSGVSGGSCGGILFNGASATIENATFVDVTATVAGNALCVYSGTATLTHVTIQSNNSVTNVHVFGGSAVARNSIIAGTVSTSHCGGVVGDGGGNLSFNDTGSCPFGTVGNPNFGGYDLGGGFLPILSPSAAENLGVSNCLATDTRGVGRGTPCDAGSYEIP